MVSDFQKTSLNQSSPGQTWIIHRVGAVLVQSKAKANITWHIEIPIPASKMAK